jgi:hypothetical protein
MQAISIQRWYGGASEKRKYGGRGTVTLFYVAVDEQGIYVWGHGATPGERKTHAILKAEAIPDAQREQHRLEYTARR